MVRAMTPNIRLLPNAITVLALCAGLSSVQFALHHQWTLAIGAIGVAAVLDSLDGRIARLLDATSKMGAEIDSLSDAVSFGVAPALVLYIWQSDTQGFGWITALVFAVCMVLRLARFNTLLEVEKPPYANEFFVGVPAPAGGLLALLPLIFAIEFGDGWWSSRLVVWLWTVAIGMLLISRIPTLSLKTVRAPAKAAAPLLVIVCLLAAAIIQYPLLALAMALLLYLVHIPYSIRRYHWLANHPEAWNVPRAERRAIRRARGTLRIRLRRPRFRRVAGAARLGVRLPRSEHVVRAVRTFPPDGQGRTRRRSWRRIGLRQRNR